MTEEPKGNIIEGWLCPPIMTGPAAYLRRSLDLDQQVKHARSARRVAVQAGGHIGISPKKLAGYFERVYTFEPEFENFACLAVNAALPNVYASRAALGEKRGLIGLIQHPKSTGGHQIGDAGSIPMMTIDGIGLDFCDAIFLDVEGYEIPVLKGAWATIKKHKPLLVLEENKKMYRRGYVFGDLEKLLAPLGYSLVERLGEDIVLEFAK